jgi:hypothetical protein
VLRLQRALGTAWNVGVTGTAWRFAGSANDVAASDVRIRLTPAWTFSGWCAASRTADNAGEGGGLASNLHLKRAGRDAAISLFYLDRSPEFRTELGFSPRRDVRLVEHYGEYRWRPQTGPVLAYGPNSFFRVEWDHDNTLRGWLVRFPFQVDMPGRTSIFVRHVESYDRVQGVDVRGHFNSINFSTVWWRWLTISQTLDYGIMPNFQPPPSQPPTAADALVATLDVQSRPTPAFQLGVSYLYNGLRSRPTAESAEGSVAIFDHHLARSRISYQFTRELSLRAIIDYDGFLSNPTWVSTAPRRRFGLDFLLTYLVGPGTACYVGYTHAVAAIDDGPDAVDETERTLGLVGRRVFAKVSRRFPF